MAADSLLQAFTLSPTLPRQGGGSGIVTALKMSRITKLSIQPHHALTLLPQQLQQALAAVQMQDTNGDKAPGAPQGCEVAAQPGL